MTYGGKNEAGPPTHGMAPRRGLLEVVALRDQKTGEEIAIVEARRYVIGQSPSCDVVVSDPCVSRTHCVIERRDGGVYVRDKDSRNGTFINDRRVECGELTPGIELGIGTTRYLVLGPRVGTERSAFARLIGQDRTLRQAIEQSRRAALTDVSVLVVGETGTGKELVAQAIHEASSRARGPFIPLNCGAIPRELIGSELYGHERGAFTGAATDRDGVFAQADRGTLFLDELGELPLEQQPHLLRVLETRRVRRVGGAHERAVDVRVVAATNRMSGLGTERGSLRVDLYHRVATVLIQLPPLRDRLDDLDELCAEILGDLAGSHGHRELSDAARGALRAHTWPGNVRELRQALMRAHAFSNDVIEPEHLFPPSIRRPTPTGVPVLAPGSVPVPALAGMTAGAVDLAAMIDVPRYDAVVRDIMQQSLARHGTIRAAAGALGMPKSTFAERAKRLGLPVPVRVRGRR